MIRSMIASPATMMSARCGLEALHFAAPLQRHLRQVGHQVTNLRPRHAEAPHRLAGLPLPGHDDRRQRRERAARAEQHVGHERRLADFFLQRAIDEVAQLRHALLAARGP